MRMRWNFRCTSSARMSRPTRNRAAAVLDRRVAGEEVAPAVLGDGVVGGGAVEPLAQPGDLLFVEVAGERLIGGAVRIEDETDLARDPVPEPRSRRMT